MTDPVSPDALRTGPSRQRCFVVALVLLTVATFCPVLTCGFVDYDDGLYVTFNDHVSGSSGGLTLANLVWDFTVLKGFWHPLTWLSLQLDQELYCGFAWGFHLTNLLLHIGSVVLLFASLAQMTGNPWPAALAAALFAVHPLNVEPVAWVAERKGVLSTFFWMLTLYAYARYVKRPGVLRYLAILFAMTLGFLSKPMIVTIPCVLLLLDFWPLRRLGTVPLVRLVGEKLPLFALSAVGSVIAHHAEQVGGALQTLEDFPWSVRIPNAIGSYGWYLQQLIWPTELAVYQPFRESDRPMTWAVAGLAMLLWLTVLAFALRRRMPYVLMGWLWYVGTLVPVCGLVQVGVHARADRYAYVPLVGIFIALAWGLADLARAPSRRWLAGVAVPVLVCFAIVSWLQCLTWQNAETLWEGACRATGGSWLAHSELGILNRRGGRPREAIRHHRLSVTYPRCAPLCHYLLGDLLLEQGEFAEASLHLRQSPRDDANAAPWRLKLGEALLYQGKFTEAADVLREEMQAHPRDGGADYLLGMALHLNGDTAEAAGLFQKMVLDNPKDAHSRRGLAFALEVQGEHEKAKAELREACRLEPDWTAPALKLAWQRAAGAAFERRGWRGVYEAELLRRLAAVDDPALLDVVGAAYAEVGRFDDAVTLARRAQERATAAGRTNLAQEIAGRLREYESGRPWRASHGSIPLPRAGRGARQKTSLTLTRGVAASPVDGGSSDPSSDRVPGC
jgi:protein O-mannosyl-transferase